MRMARAIEAPSHLRFGIAVVVLTIALFVAHKWLPAAPRMIEILPVSSPRDLVAHCRRRLRPLSRRVLVAYVAITPGSPRP
jgi:hypothetical protein